MPALTGPALVAAALLALAGAQKLVDPTMTVGALRALRLPSSPWLVRLGSAAELALGVAAIVVGGAALWWAVAASYLAFARLRGGRAAQGHDDRLVRLLRSRGDPAALEPRRAERWRWPASPPPPPCDRPGAPLDALADDPATAVGRASPSPRVALLPRSTPPTSSCPRDARRRPLPDRCADNFWTCSRSCCYGPEQ